MGTQFVVQIENHPGALAHFAHALAERGVNHRPLRRGRRRRDRVRHHRDGGR